MVIAIPISIMVISGEQDTDANINCAHYSSIVMNGVTDLRLPVHCCLALGPLKRDGCQFMGATNNKKTLKTSFR